MGVQAWVGAQGQPWIGLPAVHPRGPRQPARPEPSNPAPATPAWTQGQSEAPVRPPIPRASPPPRSCWEPHGPGEGATWGGGA